MFKEAKACVKKYIYSVRKCRGIKTSALRNNRGVAMIYGLIVGMVVMVFCLSLILVTYTLFAQVNRKNSQLQCKMLAQTFAEELANDLMKNDDSELKEYMGTAIKAKSWKSLDEMSQNPSDTDYTKLIVDCDSETGYTYNVVFTYIINSADDGENVDNSGKGEEAGNGVNAPAEEVNCTVYSTIICRRGAGKDRDTTSYTTNGEYDISIPLK